MIPSSPYHPRRCRRLLIAIDAGGQPPQLINSSARPDWIRNTQLQWRHGRSPGECGPCLLEPLMPSQYGKHGFLLDAMAVAREHRVMASGACQGS
jgi:hypothetical protein